MKILLGLTGSVATLLACKIVGKLKKNGHEVKVVATDKAHQILRHENTCFHELTDKDEFYYNHTYKKDDPILHIELRDWADTFLICPCSANTMAKMVNGICDNLLTSVFRAWDFKKPVYVAPSMNTQMWLHPVTNAHLETLKEWKVNVIYPTVKKLACGDFGVGGLADINTIVNITEGHRWEYPFDLTWSIGNGYSPLFPHPGSFGVKRHTCYHAGVDRYSSKFEHVVAMEDGEVISIGQFTGAGVGCEWWNDTWQITIKGKSGVIVYGEIEVNEKLKVGDKVKARDYLGIVLEVLKNSPKYPVEGHSRSMLHIELLDNSLIECPDWKIGEDRPKGILDPTPYLYFMQT